MRLSPDQQYRREIGNHQRWQDAKQGTQKSQDQHVRILAEQPGLHAGNRRLRSAAQAYVQLLSLLSSAQSSNVTFASTPARVEERQQEGRIAQADALFRYRHPDLHSHPDVAKKESDEASVQGRDESRTVSDHHAGRPWGQAQYAGGRTNPDASLPLPGDELSRYPIVSVGPARVQTFGDNAGGRHLPASSPGAEASPRPVRLRFPRELMAAERARPPTPAVQAVTSSPMKVVELNETAAHRFWASLVGGEDGQFMADKIGNLTTGKEMMLSAAERPRMGKRAALSTLEAQENAAYRAYLQNNCHIRTKTVQGDPIGDSLLVAGEYTRNPWRGLAESVNELIWPGSPLSETAETASEYFNLGTDILLGFFTLGAYPIIKYGAAKSLSVSGQATNGDMTCLKREFSPEEMARLLFDTEIGITHHQPLPQLFRKPAELAGVATFKPSGLFVEEHLPSGIRMEKYMAIHKDGAEVLIREKSPGNFVTCHPHAVDPQPLEQRVFFDAHTQRIYFGEETARGQGYPFSITEGRKFIHMQGKDVELLYHPVRQRLEIQVERGDVSSQLPVYMEKLSHAWHLGVHNDHPVFSARQAALIDKIKLPADADNIYVQVDNLHPRSYGTGKIVEVRRSGAAPSDAADLLAIEMHGELVPVRLQTVEGHGVRYEAYDAAAAERRGRLVEWDGLRWIFDRSTSVHIVSKLKRLIDASMFDRTVSAHELSAPDQRGIRWDRHDRGFLKVKGGFVRVRQYGYHPDAFYLAHAGKKTNLFFENNRFHVENLTHRLQRIQTQGMSGRGAGHAFREPAAVPDRAANEHLSAQPVHQQQQLQAQGNTGGTVAAAPARPGEIRFRSAAQIIQDCFNYTPEEAARYLGQFQFQDNGIFTIREFALYIESYDALPHWARRGRTDDMQPALPVSAQRAPVLHADAPGTGRRVNLGERISEGGEGTVFFDATDSTFVFKQLKSGYFVDRNGNGHRTSIYTLQRYAMIEAQMFNQYYGAGMAQMIVEGSEVYIRMPKIPGKELRALEKGEMPDDGAHLFLDMLERMNNVGIWHGDLHPGNIMFDPVDKVFYPIDLSNTREHYLKAKGREKDDLNTMAIGQWNEIMRMISEKMDRPVPGSP